MFLKKSYYKVIVIIISMTFSFSCNTKEDKNIVSFTIGYNTNHLNRGVFFDKKNSEYQFWFVNPQHDPKIKFYNINGEFLDSISLNVDKNQNINNLTVLSKDTILVIEGNQNSIDVLDRKGTIVYTQSLRKMIRNFSNDNYFFVPFKNSSIKNVELKNLVFAIYYAGNDYVLNNATEEDNFDLFFDEQRKSYHVANVKNLLDATSKVTMNLGLKGFSAIENEGEKIINRGGEYNVIHGKDNFIFFSVFTKMVYEIDNDLKIVKKINTVPSSSEHSSLEGIFNVMFDPFLNQYYVVIFKYQDKLDLIDEKPISFFVQSYDDKFNFINQQEFSTKKYNPMTILLTKKGLYIELINNQEYGKVNYEIFNTM